MSFQKLSFCQSVFIYGKLLVQTEPFVMFGEYLHIHDSHDRPLIRVE